MTGSLCCFELSVSQTCESSSINQYLMISYWRTCLWVFINKSISDDQLLKNMLLLIKYQKQSDWADMKWYLQLVFVWHHCEAPSAHTQRQRFTSWYMLRPWPSSASVLCVCVCVCLPVYWCYFRMLVLLPILGLRNSEWSSTWNDAPIQTEQYAEVATNLWPACDFTWAACHCVSRKYTNCELLCMRHFLIFCRLIQAQIRTEVITHTCSCLIH